MKKIMAMALVSTLVLSMTVGVFAHEKEADVTVTLVNEVDEYVTGVAYQFEATTLKKGSSVDVNWEVNRNNSNELVEVDFYLDENGYYVSTADFTGYNPGEYTISAEYIMKAGNSHVSWIGSDSEMIKLEGVKEDKGNNSKSDVAPGQAKKEETNINKGGKK